MFAPVIMDGLKAGVIDTKLRAGKYYTPVNIEVEDGRLLFHFGYNADLITEIKESFENRKYHGFIEGDKRKIWSAPITFRNLFQLQALMGKYAADPYARWSGFSDATLEAVKLYCTEERPHPVTPFNHQYDMISHGLSAKWFLWAAEMGTGKTLAAMILLEMFKPKKIWWLGPTSALAAARAEFRKWKSRIYPEFYTYDAIRGIVKNWEPGDPAPDALICDESSRCKTPNAQRSVAVKHVADSMREEHGDNCIIGLLSGSPAPKSPADWWMQCEILCPGFLREANIHVFRKRLGVFEEQESAVAGAGSYNKLVTWKDDVNKCAKCGKMKDDLIHNMELSWEAGTHTFVETPNEVANLQKRMNGLVLVKFKRDCLDLPEKRYKIYRCTPSQELLNAAKLIVQTSTRTVDALIKLRTLSDGFIYKESGTGEFIDCPGCKGTGEQIEYGDSDRPDDALLPEEIAGAYRIIWSDCPEGEDPLEFVPTIIDRRPFKLIQRNVTCWHCGGERKVERMHRVMDEVPCPKDDVLIDLLEMHEEVGRFNVYAGFEGSINRVTRICRQKGWTTFKADGKGWVWTEPTSTVLQMERDRMLEAFDDTISHEKVVFIGQPGAAGMGLTLTASPGTFFFSNDYVPENRMQAEDRGHRPGMDVEKGGWIYDVFHLPSDEKVYTALKRSKKLQHMSLTGLQEWFDESVTEGIGK